MNSPEMVAAPEDAKRFLDTEKTYALDQRQRGRRITLRQIFLDILREDD